jgi:hypothetical protein
LRIHGELHQSDRQRPKHAAAGAERVSSNYIMMKETVKICENMGIISSSMEMKIKVATHRMYYITDFWLQAFVLITEFNSSRLYVFLETIHIFPINFKVFILRLASRRVDDAVDSFVHQYNWCVLLDQFLLKR